MLKATNGFGSSTASMIVRVQPLTSGGSWTNAGNLKFISGSVRGISLPGNRVLFDWVGTELYDFNDGTSKQLPDLPGVSESWVLLPDQKLFARTSTTTGTTYDTLTGAIATVTLDAPGGMRGNLGPQIDDRNWLVTNYFSAGDPPKIEVGFFEYPSFKYTKTAEIPRPDGFADGGGGLIGLTKEKNALLWISRPEARFITINPKTGTILGNVPVGNDIRCLLKSRSSVVFPGPVTLLPNGNFLGGYGGVLDTSQSSLCEYNPATNTVVEGSILELGSSIGFVLNNGKVFFAPASYNNNPYARNIQAGLYDPISRIGQLTPLFNQERFGEGYVQLSDGRIVVAGGVKPRTYDGPPDVPQTPLSSIEVYTP